MHNQYGGHRVRIRNIIKFVASLIVCYVAGFVGSIYTRPAIPAWYVTLNKPSFTPPNWLFFPVWTTLYGLMGISLFLIWREGLKEKRVATALVLFAIQLILNALWSIAFFGLRSPVSGLVIIIVLWIAILLTMIWFFRISGVAGWLLIPYLIWVGFAVVLNLQIYRLNP